MPAIRLQQFDGIYPRQGDYSLPDAAAQVAQNVKLYAGEVRAWQKPVLVDPEPTLVTGAQAVYRLERPSDSAFTWVSFAVDVDIVGSPIADAIDGRIYYTGQATPRKTTYALATSGAQPHPFDYYEWGVPSPLAALSASSTGGTGGVQTRVYVYTYVTMFGAVAEESAPSPPFTVDSQVTGATVSITGLGTAGPAGKYNFTKKRIYRTVGGTVGVDYRLVAEIPITQDTYTDTLNDAQLPGDPIVTLDFAPPPSDLIGVVAMPGRFFAGFRRNTNELYFTEPNYPHAWPVKYALSVDHQIVGLGVVGNLLAVMTVRSPELIYGSTPDALGQEKIPLIEPCASKRSIATNGDIVIYASPNGLVGIGPGTRARFTDKLFRRDEFQVYEPSSMYGKVYDGTYFGYFNSAAGKGAILVNSIDTPALSQLSQERFTTAAYIDSRTAALYFVDPEDDKLYEFDASLQNNDAYTWRSKKFDSPFPISAGVLQVYADYDFINEATYDAAADIAFNTALIAAGTVRGATNTTPINTYSVNGSALRRAQQPADVRFVQVRVYGDGELIVAHGFENERHKKMPSGRRYRTIELEAVGNVPIYSITLATTTADLKEV